MDKPTIPQKPPFEELPKVVDLKTKRDNDLSALMFMLKSKLAAFGRDMPKYPDDEDLMHWYSDEQRDIQKWYYRDYEDLRQSYDRGEL